MAKRITDRKLKWMDFLNGANGVRTMYFINVVDDGDEHGYACNCAGAGTGPENNKVHMCGRIGGGGGPGERPLPWPGLIENRIDWAYQNYCREMSRAEWLCDDRIPSLLPYTGTEIFAEAFGCKVYYPDNNMPFALPLYGNAKEAAGMKIPRVHDTPLDNLFEIARRLRQKTDGGAVVNLPDIQSPLDIAALILNKEEFFIAMSEDPPLIHDMIEKTKSLLTAFLDEWFDEFGRSYIAHFPSYYMEGGMTLSEDEIGAFGPGMFEDFVLGALNELSAKYGGIGIHCCADSEHQWANLKKVKGLKILNLVNGADFIKRSNTEFADTVALWPMGGARESANEPGWLRECPGNARVVLTYRAQNRREAIEIAGRAEELCAARAGL